MLPLELFQSHQPQLEQAIAEVMGVHQAHPWTESPFFYDVLEKAKLPKELSEIAVQFHEDGFIVDQLDLKDGLLNDVREMHQRYPELARHLTNAWKREPIARDFACRGDVLALLKFLYGRNPVPYQTLNFQVGTEQRVHQDSIHFNSVPARFMSGVWIAFEAITPDNGPLFYIPGSHRWPFWDSHDIGYHQTCHTYKDRGEAYTLFLEAYVKQMKGEKRELHAPAGTMLIWASNLFHGGQPIKKEGATRYSMVTHYFYENCQYHSALLSSPFSGDTRLIDFDNILTGEKAYNPKSTLPPKGPWPKRFYYYLRSTFKRMGSKPSDMPYYS